MCSQVGRESSTFRSSTGYATSPMLNNNSEVYTLNITIVSIVSGFLALDGDPAVSDVQAVAAPKLLQSVSVVIGPIMLLASML